MTPLLPLAVLAVMTAGPGTVGPGAAAAQDAASLTRIGTETRSMFFTDCYAVTVFDPDGRLTADDLTDDAQPRRLEVEVLYDGDLPEMPEGWTEDIMPVLSPGKEAKIRAAYADLSAGDVIRLDYVPGEGSTVSRNGEAVLSDPGFDLTAAMLAVWFGETPVDDDIKDAFLED